MSLVYVGTTGFEPRSMSPQDQRSDWKSEYWTQKEKAHRKNDKLLKVGTTGFEPATPQPPAECSTELSHVPILIDFKIRVKYSELQRESYWSLELLLIRHHKLYIFMERV